MGAEASSSLLVIVPAYNEEASIAGVIDDVKQHQPAAQVLVVNDASRDRTSHCARATGQAEVVDLPVNLGIGGAVQTGFIYARDHGFATAIQFDGDGQHRADQIAVLLAALRPDQADVVIGSRFLAPGSGFRSSFARRLGIRTFGLASRLLTGRRVTDSTSGFRVYNRRAIGFLARHYPRDYPEPEAVVLLARNGFRVRETPTQMDERHGGRSSISGVRTLYYMAKVLLAVFIGAMRPRAIGD